MSYKATSPTIGRAGIGEHKPYHYNGDKPLKDDPSVDGEPKGGAITRAAGRRQRSAEYGKFRDQGVSAAEAAERIGVGRKTRARYEAEWVASRAGGSGSGAAAGEAEAS